MSGWLIASILVAVAAAFGLRPREAGGPIDDNRAPVASRLMSELGSEIRLVHGSVSGLFGNTGTDVLMRYR